MPEIISAKRKNAQVPALRLLVKLLFQNFFPIPILWDKALLLAAIDIQLLARSQKEVLFLDLIRIIRQLFLLLSRKSNLPSLMSTLFIFPQKMRIWFQLSKAKQKRYYSADLLKMILI